MRKIRRTSTVSPDRVDGNNVAKWQGWKRVKSIVPLVHDPEELLSERCETGVYQLLAVASSGRGLDAGCYEARGIWSRHSLEALLLAVSFQARSF